MFEKMEGDVNAYSFALELVLDAGLFDTLGSRQIDQMEFGTAFDIRTDFVGLYVNYKDTVTSCRDIIGGCFANDSISFSYELKVKRIFFIVGSMQRKVPKHKYTIFVLIRRHPRQVSQLRIRMLFV